MELIRAIDALNAIPEPVRIRTTTRPEPVEPVLNAHVCTAFEPAACVPELAEAGIAAAAAMQDMRLFRRPQVRAERGWS